MSRDARYVTFSTNASLEANDTNNTADIYVRDTVLETTTRISTTASGGLANNISSDPSISDDGRFVTFSSFATNLVSGDTNASEDVFVRDNINSTVVLVSKSVTGALGNNTSGSPKLSCDGRYISFTSFATNLVSGDTNGVADVYLYDQLGPTLSNLTSVGTTHSFPSSITCNASEVIISSASNLTGSDTNGANDVFKYSKKDNITKLISLADSEVSSNGDSTWGSASDNGRFVAFYSSASNLVTGDSNSKQDVFIRDTQNDSTVRLSVSSTGAQSNGDSYGLIQMSADGHYVAYNSTASNLVSSDTNSKVDVFLTDTGNGTDACL